MPDFRKCPIDRQDLSYSLDEGGVYYCSGCGFEFKCEYECSGKGRDRCDECSEIIKSEARKYFKLLLGEHANSADANRKGKSRKRLLLIRNNIHRRCIKIEFEREEFERLMSVQ